MCIQIHTKYFVRENYSIFHIPYYQRFHDYMGDKHAVNTLVTNSTGTLLNE